MRFKIYLKFLVVCALLFTTVNEAAGQEIKASALRQIQSLLDEKESRNPVQKKINSQLLYAIKMERGERITIEVASLNVDVDKGVDAKVPVTIKGTITDALVKQVVAAGGEVIHRSNMFNRLLIRISLEAIEQLALLNEVDNIFPTAKASIADINRKTNDDDNVNTGVPARRVIGEMPFNKSFVDDRFSDAAFKKRAEKVREQITKILASEKFKKTEFIGAVTSEGDVTHKADLARTTFNVNGNGIKIGVLSNSYNQLGQAAANITAGDLPGVGNPNGFTTPITVLSDVTGLTQAIDEGRAMLQIIHDLAPGAQLFFATAFNGDAAFAQSILDLRAAGCDIICDDVFYLNEPPFQDGIIAQAVNTVTASGALYFSSAGNQGNKNDNTSSVWEGDFTDAGLPPSTISGGTVHDFGGGTNNNLITSNQGNSIFLFWSDAQGASANDYDLFSLDGTLTNVLASSTNIQNGDDDALEFLPAQATGRRLVILKKTGALDRALHLNMFGSRISLNTAGQTHGHSAAAAAYSVAATDADGPFPAVFNSSNVVENFSSDGLRRKFYNPNGTAITPGNFLFATNGGTVLQKPDITAADGTMTTVPGFQPFFGTSAAAPHAAAIAALLRQKNPTLTPAQIRTALTSTAIDIETPGVDRDAGHGIVMALEALTSVPASPGLQVGTATISAESCTPANSVIDPAESVTVSFCIRNFGGGATSNLVGTLLATGGVTSPSGPQNYGAITTGTTVCRTFTFTNSAVCGGTITASIQFQDGATNLGTFTYTFPVGVPVTTFTQNFDAIAAPALPATWTTDFTGAASAWTTSSTNPASAPNCAFGQEVATPGVTNLVSPNIAITNATARLSFSNLFNLEAGFDGELLEIKIGAGAFQDIITAGGSFVSGGYNGILDGSTAFPGRGTWTGLSGGTTGAPTYITTIVNLPASAAGQNVQFRWRVTSDNGTVAAGAPGVKIDNITISDGATCCVPSGPPPTVTINQAAAQVDPTSVSPINFTVVFNETVTGFATGDVTLSGTAGATTAIVTGSGTTYNVAVSGMTTSGTVIATVPAGVAINSGSISNTASTSTDNTVQYNVAPPTVTINQAAAQVDPTSASPINFTVVFNETVTGFATGDVTLSGTAGATTAIVTGSGTTYNVAVSGMTTSGTVIANIAAGVATNSGGALNLASTSTDNQVQYNVAPPTVTINQAVSQADPTATSPINFTVVFNEPVTGFATGDIDFTGSTAAGTLVGTVTGSGTTYNVAVTGMTSTGTVVASVPAGVAINTGSALNLASTSTDNSVTFNFGPPTVTINQAAGQTDPASTLPINFTVIFNEPVTGFATGDIDFTGSTAGGTLVGTVSGSGTTYNVAVTGMTSSGLVIVSVPASVAIDLDGAGNLASTSVDNSVTFINCSISCPSNVTVNSASGQCGVIVNYPAPTVIGTCGTVTASPASGSFFPVGVTTVTVTSTAGPTCTFTVTVLDATPPVITCPANITISNTPGLCSGIATFAAPVVTDNCTQPVSNTSVTWSQTGQRGAFFDITNTGAQPIVVTSINPQMFSPTPLTDVFSVYFTTTATTYLGNQTTAGAWTLNSTASVSVPGNATATAGVSVPLSSPLTLAPGQSKGVYVVGTQSFGGGPVAYLSSSGTPAYTGPQSFQNGSLRFSGGVGSSGLFTGIFGTGAPGNIRLFYGSVSYSPTYTQTAGLPSGSAFPVGTTTNTFTATDPSGNTASCSFTVTVNDTQAPTITCPSNITITTPVGSCTAVVTYAIPTGADNCPGVTVARTAGPASGSAFPIGVTTVTYQATDAAGNVSTACSFTVTVIDGQLPVITTQPANRTVCAGTTATFSVIATNAVGYQWQQWNGTAWVNVAGATASSYSVANTTQSMNTNTFRVVITGLCSVVNSSAATLFVNALPTISLSSSINSPVLIPGQVTNIIANVSPTGGTFAWFKNGAPRVPTVTTGTLSNLTVDDAGTYRATYTDPNGCVSTSADLVISAEVTDRLFVAPNPNFGQFWVRYYNQTGESLTVVVFDSKGRRVHQQQSATGLAYTRIDVDMGIQTAGIYVVELRGTGGRLLDRKQMIVAQR